MKNTDIYYARKEEKYNEYIHWWNIRPIGCNWIDRYLAFDFKEAVKKYKTEHSIKGGQFILEQ